MSLGKQLKVIPILSFHHILTAFHKDHLLRNIKLFWLIIFFSCAIRVFLIRVDIVIVKLSSIRARSPAQVLQIVVLLLDILMVVAVSSDRSLSKVPSCELRLASLTLSLLILIALRRGGCLTLGAATASLADLPSEDIL